MGKHLEEGGDVQCKPDAHQDEGRNRRGRYPEMRKEERGTANPGEDSHSSVDRQSEVVVLQQQNQSCPKNRLRHRIGSEDHFAGEEEGMGKRFEALVGEIHATAIPEKSALSRTRIQSPLEDEGARAQGCGLLGIGSEVLLRGGHRHVGHESKGLLFGLVGGCVIVPEFQASFRVC